MRFCDAVRYCYSTVQLRFTSSASDEGKNAVSLLSHTEHGGVGTVAIFTDDSRSPSTVVQGMPEEIRQCGKKRNNQPSSPRVLPDHNYCVFTAAQDDSVMAAQIAGCK